MTNDAQIFAQSLMKNLNNGFTENNQEKIIDTAESLIASLEVPAPACDTGWVKDGD